MWELGDLLLQIVRVIETLTEALCFNHHYFIYRFGIVAHAGYVQSEEEQY